ncbi:MAG: DUF1570 domain-containing protein [Planctomycetes bacterium]|nr:DUF1570 domain-containing protein [Planctomycetota bacterium]
MRQSAGHGFLLLTVLVVVSSLAQAQDQAALYEKARSAALAGEYVEAIQYARECVRIDARQAAPWQVLYNGLLRLGRYGEALDASLEAERRGSDPEFPFRPEERRRYLSEVHRARSEIYVGLAEYGKALESVLAAATTDPAFAIVRLDVAQVVLLCGRPVEALPEFEQWMNAIARYEEGERRTTAIRSMRFWRAYLGHSEAKRLTGDPDGALASLERMRKELAAVPTSEEAYWGFRVALLALSGEREKLDEAAAMAAEQLGDAADSQFARYGRGILYERLGRHAEAVRELEDFDEKAVWPEALYHLGLAELRLGQVERGTDTLAPILAANPLLKSRLETEHVPSAVREEAKERLREEGKRSVEERIERRADRRFVEETLAQIDSGLSSYRFSRAAEELDGLARLTDDEDLASEIARRRDLARSLAGVFDRVVAAAAAGKFAERPVRLTGEIEGKIVSADATKIRLAVESGWVERPWAYTPYAEFGGFSREVGLSGEELASLGEFLWDTAGRAAGEEALIEALAKGADASRVAAIAAPRLGRGVPPGGFVPYQGRLVTSEERENLKKGLVLFQDEWVTPEDRDHLKKGHEKIRGKWVPLTASELEARGWRKDGAEWISFEEYQQRKGEWSHGWTKDGAHFRVKTNKGEVFLRDLSSAADAAYEAFAGFFGREPGGALTLYAFKDFADYREYCLSLDKESELGALGFAPSEPGTACGYDKFDSNPMFLGTMIHESCHLFFWETFKVQIPSWLAEGMATYFEAHAKKGGTWTFGELNQNRLDYLKKSVETDSVFPLDQFFAADAGQLIQNDSRAALTFYAQCWGTFFFFQRTTNAAYRKGFSDYLDRMERGEKADLLAILGADRAKLEAEMKEFWKGL